MARVPFIVGNWKMHHGVEATRAQVKQLAEGMAQLQGRVQLGVAPVATTLFAAQAERAASGLVLCAQNMHFADKGAFTGEWSAPHLKELGVGAVILGHSERRAMFNETNESVGKKVRVALDAGLVPIACVGETLAEREATRTLEVVGAQVDAIVAACSAADIAQLVVAYEPVWAIGTGKTASAAQAQDVHAFIRSRIAAHFPDGAAAVRIQYGGSVKPDNARELMNEPDVDGALVGGASLEARSFADIIKNSI